LINSLGSNVEIFRAYSDNVLQGCAIIPYSEYAAFYLFGGSIADPVLGSMNLLHWIALLHFKDKGVKVYDFVGARIKPQAGSKLEGIQRFKERFGSTLSQGFLWKYPYNRPMYHLYRVLMKIRLKRLHLDIIDQENAHNAE
jgi:lipid II:glycine glycyltransferase (peptidoglycan interpeptide bridge formation enzyme)